MVRGKDFYKAFDLQSGPVLTRISGNAEIQIEPLSRQLSTTEQQQLRMEISDMFDLDRDLRTFYKLAETTGYGTLTEQRKGLRLIAIPDLFEALCWSVIGQQINLTFAYRLKQRLVQHFQPILTWQGEHYYKFPSPAQVLEISDDQFKSWQFSQSKYKYLRGIAAQMEQKELTKEGLIELPAAAAYERLLSIKGIGPWSANYVLMKSLKETWAYPLQDVGLHNALRYWWQREHKPTLEELEGLGKLWYPWQGYMTFYFWHFLLSN